MRKLAIGFSWFASTSISAGPFVAFALLSAPAGAQQPQQPPSIGQPSVALPAGPLNLQACREVPPLIHCLVVAPQARFEIQLTPQQFQSLGGRLQ